MNKNIIIGAVVVIVLVGGYFAYKNMANKSGDENATENPYMQNGNSSGVETTNPGAKKMAFDAFVRQGGSYVCSVHQSINNVDSVGTVYVANGNMMGQFDTTVQGTKMTSSMIMKDGYMYSWSSMSPNMGVKMAISANAGTNGSTSGQYGYGESQFGDYDCQPWTTDSSKFSPPSNITFTVMNSQ